MKILILRLSSLGDVVLASAAIAPLRAAGCEIYFVTKPNFHPLLEAVPGVAGVYSFDKKTMGGERAARQHFYDWVRDQKFSGFLDLHDSWRTWFWRWHLCKIAPVIVNRKKRLRELAVLGLRLGRIWGWGRGGRARQNRAAAVRLLERLGLAVKSTSEPMTELKVLPAEIAEAQRQFQNYIVLVPGSAWAGKRWSAENFAKLAGVLAKKTSRPVLVLGSAGERACEAIANAAKIHVPESQAILGRPLRDVMAFLSQASLVIGNDTGLVHIAEAFGRPCLMIEGPTHPYLGFSPYRDSTELVSLPLLCRPCSKTGKFCWRGGARTCLAELTPDFVAARAMQKWQEQNKQC